MRSVVGVAIFGAEEPAGCKHGLEARAGEPAAGDEARGAITAEGGGGRVKQRRAAKTRLRESRLAIGKEVRGDQIAKPAARRPGPVLICVAGEAGARILNDAVLLAVAIIGQHAGDETIA